MFANIRKNNQMMACGTFHLANFSRHSASYDDKVEVTKAALEAIDSTGVFMAGFRAAEKIDEEMFGLLSTLATPVYVSPVRKNPNSDRMFYFAVFDLKGDEECAD